MFLYVFITESTLYEDQLQIALRPAVCLPVFNIVRIFTMYCYTKRAILKAQCASLKFVQPLIDITQLNK